LVLTHDSVCWNRMEKEKRSLENKCVLNKFFCIQFKTNPASSHPAQLSVMLAVRNNQKGKDSLHRIHRWLVKGFVFSPDHLESLRRPSIVLMKPHTLDCLYRWWILSYSYLFIPKSFYFLFFFSFAVSLIPVNFRSANIPGLKPNDIDPLHFTPSTITVNFFKTLYFANRFVYRYGFRFRKLFNNFKLQSMNSTTCLVDK